MNQPIESAFGLTVLLQPSQPYSAYSSSMSMPSSPYRCTTAPSSAAKTAALACDSKLATPAPSPPPRMERTTFMPCFCRGATLWDRSAKMEVMAGLI